MALTKIGTWTNPVTGEADRPNRSATDMKAVFDSNTNQIKTAFNANVDALTLAESIIQKDEDYPNRYLSLDGTYTTPSVGEAANGVAQGGTAGQIYKKKSAADYDAEWTSPAHASTHATGGTDAVTPAAIGAIADPATKSSGQYLTYDGSAWVAGDISLTKVWENSSTTSSFAGQTVNLSESDTYALYLIKFSAAITSATSSNGMLYQFAGAGELGVLVANRSSTPDQYASRIFRVRTDHKATFNEAYANGSSDSSLMIPCIIYGVKGVAIQ